MATRLVPDMLLLWTGTVRGDVWFISAEWHQLTLTATDVWTRQRKWVHSAMAEFHRNHFYGVIETEVRRFLAVLMLDPAKFHANTREHCGRIMSRLAWDDAALGKENGDSADCTLTQMSVSGPIVNTMTPLWSIPWALNPWKKFERSREDSQRAWWLASFQLSKKRFLKGDLPKDTWSYKYFDGLQSAGNKDLEQDAKEEEFASCMLGFQVSHITLTRRRLLPLT